MKHAKLLAMLTVLVMVIGSLTCIVTTNDNDGSYSLEDQGTVVLDAGKDYKGNAKELTKLGINDPASWEKEGNKTTLLLDGVEYMTSKAHGIDIIGNCSDFNIIVKNENSITCGRDKGSETYTDCIFVDDTIGKITFSGDGLLILYCFGTAVANGGSALYVENNLTISGCNLFATGPDVNQPSKVIGDYSSNGIVVNKGNLVIKDYAKVVARGGDVFSRGECIVGGEKHSTKSTGVYVGANNATSTITMDHALLYAFGGNVESEAKGFLTPLDPIFKIDVTSTGIYAPGNISLNNATFRGYGGSAVGTYINHSESVLPLRHVSSEGMKFGGNIDAVESEICMFGGEAESCGLAVSAGMRHFNILGQAPASDLHISLDWSDIYAYGYKSKGNPAEDVRAKFGGSFGLFASEVGVHGKEFNLAITLKGTVAVFEGYETEEQFWSVGLRMLGNTPVGQTPGAVPVGSILVDGSELYLNGYTKAILAKELKTVDGNYKYCVASTNPLEKGSTVTPEQLLGNFKCCVVGYYYNLYTYAYDSVYSPFIVYDYETTKMALPEYEMTYVPAGKVFKCWSVDGVEYQVGDEVDASNGPVVVVAVWDDAPEPPPSGDSDNTLLWIAIIFTIIIAIALLALVIVYTRPKKV